MASISGTAENFEGTSSATTLTLTHNFTTNPTDGRAFLKIYKDLDDVSSATCDGTSATQIGTTLETDGLGRFAEWWEAPHPGATGNADWVVTRSASTSSDYFCQAFEAGAASAAENYASEEGDTTSPYDLSVTSGGTSDLVVGWMATEGVSTDTLSVGGGSTELLAQNNTTTNPKMSIWEAGVSGTVVLDWSGTASQLATALTGFNIPDAGGAPPAGPNLLPLLGVG